MARISGLLAAALLTVSLNVAWVASDVGSYDENWPQWRGPHGTGLAAGSAPVRWSATENVRWKIEIPGRGHSSPIVWGDQIFLTTAIPIGSAPEPEPEQGQRRGGGGAGPLVEHRFEVISIDRRTGDVRWRQTATVDTPHEGFHRMYGSFASNSPVTDGERLYAFFGSRGIYCYDLEGNLLWKKDLGVQMQMRLQFGEGVAPVVAGDSLILNFDHEGDSFLVVLDKLSGNERWRVSRDEASSWSMPVVLTHDGIEQVIVSATNKVRSYDLKTGELVWECAGLGTNVIPTPIFYDGKILVMSGHRNPNLMAIRLGGRGDLSGSDAVVWSESRGTSYTASPVLYEGRLYFLTDSGMMSAFDAGTGEPHYHQVRLPGPYNFKASPVLADGRLYLASEEGDVIVLRAGTEFEVLAVNKMEGHVFISSPAIVGGDLYLRSQTHLFAIGE
jgi:outer membrane protein assembly factor BamB